MHELQKNTMEVVDSINQTWVNAIQDAAKESKPVNVTAIMGKYSENVRKLLQHFRDAEERMHKPMKKGFFR
jgi:hypothetical protein